LAWASNRRAKGRLALVASHSYVSIQLNAPSLRILSVQVGNVFQLNEDNWLTFTDWKDKYGAIVGINLAGKNTIILNTNKVASDLLDKRASIYSDRELFISRLLYISLIFPISGPRLIVAQEMMCGGLLLVFTQYGEMWRRMRRAAHQGLYSHAAENYHTLQETEAAVLVDGILKTPDAWDDHLKRTSASQIMAMIYDTPPIKSHEEPLITRVNNLVQRIVKSAYPGEHMVEFFPWLNKLPNILTPWKDYAAYWHRKDTDLFMDYYKTVEDRVVCVNELGIFGQTDPSSSSTATSGPAWSLLLSSVATKTSSPTAKHLGLPESW
jgi:hypothetical protein